MVSDQMIQIYGLNDKAPSPIKPQVVGAGSKVTQEFCLATRRGSGIIAQTKCEINLPFFHCL